MDRSGWAPSVRLKVDMTCWALLPLACLVILTYPRVGGDPKSVRRAACDAME